ncbi:MAG TPA: tetratricopeptide repeat protein [Verrucomicrobiae bacterium]|nr:tetratricopeptide repeat protein [Verrucomicrobiae bacterium]
MVLMSLGLAFRAEGASIAFPEFSVEDAQHYLEIVAPAFQAQAGEALDTYFILARLQNRLGHQDEAERLARQALARDAHRADIQSFLGELFIQQDRLQEAAGCLRRAIELDPKRAADHRRLGMVLDRLGNRPGAREEFAAGLRLAPADATAQLLLGRLLLDEKQPAEAAAHLAKACQLDPSSANAFYVLSQAQAQLGDQNASKKTLENFQQLKQKEKQTLAANDAAYDDQKIMRSVTVGFHTDAGTLFFQRGRADLAEAHLRQAVRIDPKAVQPCEMLVGYYSRTGALPSAREMYENLTRLRPQQTTYHVNLGTVLLRLKEYPAAAEELKRALELDPKQPEALNNLTRFYLGARRELPEALTLCRRLIDLEPTAANYDLLAQVCYANGQTNDARVASAQAVERDPNNPIYRERQRHLTPNP